MTRGALRTLCLLCIVAAATEGCNLTEDVADQYDLYRETRMVLVAHLPEFRDPSIPLEKIPPGKGHWISNPKAVAELLAAMEFVPDDPPADAEPKFALVFIPEDPLSRMVFNLDGNLNLLPGFRHHGSLYGSRFFKTTDKFKKILLRMLEPCPQCRVYHPVLATDPPRPKNKGRTRR